MSLEMYMKIHGLVRPGTELPNSVVPDSNGWFEMTNFSIEPDGKRIDLRSYFGPGKLVAFFEWNSDSHFLVSYLSNPKEVSVLVLEEKPGQRRKQTVMRFEFGEAELKEHRLFINKGQDSSHRACSGSDYVRFSITFARMRSMYRSEPRPDEWTNHQATVLSQLKPIPSNHNETLVRDGSGQARSARRRQSPNYV